VNLLTLSVWWKGKRVMVIWIIRGCLAPSETTGTAFSGTGYMQFYCEPGDSIAL
jgi:hypothetical protein